MHKNPLFHKIAIGVLAGGAGILGLRRLQRPKFSNIQSPIQVLDDSPHFKVMYDRSKRIPVAVEVLLTKSSVSGSATRKNSRFFEDKRVPFMFRSRLSDYWSQYAYLGVNRGHMVGAGDFRGDQSGMNKTFSLVNILPQDSDCNADAWYVLEFWARSLTK